MVSDSCKKRFGKIMLEQMELLEQVEIAPNIFSMILKGQMVAQMQAGQFYIFGYQMTASFCAGLSQSRRLTETI